MLELAIRFQEFLRDVFAHYAHMLLRRQYVGQLAFKLDRVTNQEIGSGKIIGCDPYGILQYLEWGHGLQHTRRVDYRDMQWDSGRKAWVFYD